MKQLFLILTLLVFISNQSFEKYGTASYYHEKFNGRKTASGQLFNSNEFTAAHKSLPFGTIIKVTNIKNNKIVFVEITDRGPFIQNRILDLSRRAFLKIADHNKQGLLKIKYSIYE